MAMAMNILRPQIIDPRWESTLPGPPGRNNGGAADIAASGLLAYAAGSSVSVVDTRSMQLVTVIPVPPPAFCTPPSSTSSSSSSSTVSPFVTSVRWAPHSLLRHIDVLSTTDVHSLSSHLVLAAGDRHGRLFLLDLRARSPLLFFDTDDSLKLGIQDICWVQSHVDTWILAAVNGPHVFSLYSTSTGKCFFKYDAKREFISCIRRDPFDSRHFCALGLKGLLFSVKVMGDSSEDDVVLKELQIRIDSTELEKLERDLAGGSSNSPASAIFPTYPAKCSFSIEWRHILFVSFPRELVVFDLQYETTLFGASMPRGGKFLDIFPDPSRELLYCVHLDGKLSTWKRREGEQAYTMCTTQELMPLVGSSLPYPCILAAVIYQPDSPLQSIGKIYSDVPHTAVHDEDYNSPFYFCDEGLPASKTHLISISDDGKVWNWLLTTERADDYSTVQQPNCVNRRANSSNFNAIHEDISSKVILVGQLHLLSSTVIALAVPSPSLTATLARGGNYPAVTVPLVALGTQSGTIEVIDVSANAIAACFSVHSRAVRGLRWLGNSRLVSFSYHQKRP